METLTIGKIITSILEDKNLREFLCIVLAASAAPVILFILVFLELGNAESTYNRKIVDVVLKGGSIPVGVTSEVSDYYSQMQDKIDKLDTEWGERHSEDEDWKKEEHTDRELLMKAAFFEAYCENQGELNEEDYENFAEAFDNENSIGDVLKALSEKYAITLNDEKQSNVLNLWSLALNGESAPLDGDGSSGWSGWSDGISVPTYDLADNANGNEIVELAMSRLDDPYSQKLRGFGKYVDCSYLTQWCYKKVGISIPGTAANQAKFLAENCLSIAPEDLQPGDLIFWSQRPNGRYLNITHVGIYAGDGMIVDASSSNKKVVNRALFDEDKIVMYGRPMEMN